MTIAFRPGEVRRLGAKTMGLCQECDKLVRMDKPLFGSLHICNVRT